MSTRQRLFLLMCLTATTTLLATGCTASPLRAEGPPRLHPIWAIEMAAGLDASELGELDVASRHYRDAVRLARSEQLPSEELAFSIYRLGEAIRMQPALAEGEQALALLQEARRHFARAYGPRHPVLIPVWIRIASIQAQQGDIAAASASRATADVIAIRFFPERHFLRERFGAARPAAILHPLEILRLIGEPEQRDDPERVVQGSY